MKLVLEDGGINTDGMKAEQMHEILREMHDIKDEKTKFRDFAFISWLQRLLSSQVSLSVEPDRECEPIAKLTPGRIAITLSRVLKAKLLLHLIAFLWTLFRKMRDYIAYLLDLNWTKPRRSTNLIGRLTTKNELTEFYAYTHNSLFFSSCSVGHILLFKPYLIVLEWWTGVHLGPVPLCLKHHNSCLKIFFLNLSCTFFRYVSMYVCTKIHQHWSLSS